MSSGVRFAGMGEKKRKRNQRNEHSAANFNFRRATQNCVSLASKWGGLARHWSAKGKYRCFCQTSDWMK
jgi:hypothetical protein